MGTRWAHVGRTLGRVGRALGTRCVGTVRVVVVCSCLASVLCFFLARGFADTRTTHPSRFYHSFFFLTKLVIFFVFFPRPSFFFLKSSFIFYFVSSSFLPPPNRRQAISPTSAGETGETGDQLEGREVVVKGRVCSYNVDCTKCHQRLVVSLRNSLSSTPPVKSRDPRKIN